MAERLVRVRSEKGLKQSEIAEMLGVSKNYVYLIEAGRNKPSRKITEKLDRIESGESNNQNFLRKVMPPDFFDEIEAQWSAQTTEQLKTLLQHKVDRNDWGAVQLVARKLQDRELTEFNQKLLKGEEPR